MSEPDPTIRPEPAAVHTGVELQRWYWLREELVAMARARGVRTTGPKLVLAERLAAHLDGRPFDEPPTPRRPTGPPLAGPLTRDTVIPPGQRSSQALRAFFVEEIWPGFRFDGEMRAFVEGGAGRTLGDAVDHWHATRDRPTGAIAPQFELNRFLRAWHESHPGRPRADAMAAWKAHRSRPRS